VGESAANSDNPGVDPIVVAILLLILVPVGVIWALSKSSSMRGPSVPPTSRRPVESLVTEAIPEEHPDPEEESEDVPDFDLSADSEPAPDEPRDPR